MFFSSTSERLFKHVNIGIYALTKLAMSTESFHHLVLVILKRPACGPKSHIIIMTSNFVEFFHLNISQKSVSASLVAVILESKPSMPSNGLDINGHTKRKNNQTKNRCNKNTAKNKDPKKFAWPKEILHFFFVPLDFCFPN